MKLSLAIIIVSALLLTAVSGENAETPKAQPNQNAYAQSPAQQHGSPSGASVSTPFQITSAPPANHRDTNTYDYNYPAKNGWDWSGIIQAVATLGLLGFALWQMEFVRRSTIATENAANAARDNALASKNAAAATEDYAKTQRLALVAQRPVLLVVEVDHGFFDPKSREDKTFVLTSAKVTITNAGQGQAVIKRVMVD